MNKWLIILLMTVGLSACDSGRVFDEYKSIEGKSWGINDLVSFDFEIENPQEAHDIIIKLRHNNSYAFSNVYFFVNLESPQGVQQLDTVQFLVAEPSGKWLGEGIGELKTNQFLLGDHITFPQEGKYSVTIQHGMRTERLDGVEDIGLRVAKAENE